MLKECKLQQQNTYTWSSCGQDIWLCVFLDRGQRICLHQSTHSTGSARHTDSHTGFQGSKVQLCCLFPCKPWSCWCCDTPWHLADMGTFNNKINPTILNCLATDFERYKIAVVSIYQTKNPRSIQNLSEEMMFHLIQFIEIQARYLLNQIPFRCEADSI